MSSFLRSLEKPCKRVSLYNVFGIIVFIDNLNVLAGGRRGGSGWRRWWGRWGGEPGGQPGRGEHLPAAAQLGGSQPPLHPEKGTVRGARRPAQGCEYSLNLSNWLFDCLRYFRRWMFYSRGQLKFVDLNLKSCCHSSTKFLVLFFPSPLPSASQCTTYPNSHHSPTGCKHLEFLCAIHKQLKKLCITNSKI